MSGSTLLRLGIFGLLGIGAVVGFVFRDRLTGDASDIRVGDCVMMPSAGEFAEIQHKPCSEPHEAEVFLVVDHPAQEAYPTDAQFEAFYLNTCRGPAFEQYTGLTFEAAVDIDADYFTPTEEGWEGGDHEMVCLLIPAGGGTVDRSYKQA